MAEEQQRRRQINWAPYLLLLPSTLFLVIFFAWPMFRSLTLAFYAEEVILNINAEPSRDSARVGQLHQSDQTELVSDRGIALDLTGMTEEEIDALEPEYWYFIQWTDEEGATHTGWVPESYIREDETTIEGGIATAGTVRRRDRDVRLEPGNLTDVTGHVLQNTPVEIHERAAIQLWYEVRGPINLREGEIREEVTGWARSDRLDIITEGDELTVGLVRSGDAGEWTLRFIERMVNDRDFGPALRYTVLLIVLILPIQFVLAFIMALVLQQRLRGNTIFLYIYSIPLATSDLAVGLVWLSVFTESGWLNSFLQGMGLINSPITYLSNETKYWMIIAIVLAEVWRATSIVMVIIVSGLQAVPTEYLEAAELFGANMWQRIRYVILPLLKPSLQVALILRTILAFQVFGVVIAIAGGVAITVLANEAYLWYVEFSNDNLAAAYAGFILLISMITAVFYLRAVRTQEELAA